MIIPFLAASSAANAAAIFTTETSVGGTFDATAFTSTPSSTDLVGAGQSSLLSVVSTGIANSQIANINDGVDPVTTGTAGVNTDIGDSITFNLDTTVNTLGYDITDIFSLAGGGQRSAQGFDVSVTFVDGTTALLISSDTAAGAFLPGDPSNVLATDSFFNNFSGTGFTTVSIVESSGGLLASGVASVTFDNFSEANRTTDADGNGGGVVVFREFDVFGSATVEIVPEPSVYLLAVFGVPFVAFRRRR